MPLKIPTVSIVIFAYERISYLPATIDSILQQTDGNFESLIFSDDYRQIDSWFRRQPDNRLRFILQNNLGLAATLNQGVLEAQGKYIAFIRAGDLWHPSKLQQQLSCLDRYPEIGLIHSGFLSIDDRGQDTSSSFLSQRLLRRPQGGREASALAYHSAYRTTKPTLTVGQFFCRTKIVSPIANLLQPSEILAQNRLHLSSVMLRRSCFEMVGLFNPKLQIIPDWEMWIRLSNYYQFMAIAKPLVYDRQSLEHKQNWLTLETDLQTTIETAYANLFPELERQKQKYRSYGFASLFLAQNALQAKNSNSAIARNYWYQALVHNPLVIFSPKFCLLRWAIFRLHCQQYYRQSDLYRHLLQLMQNARSRFKIAIPQTREHSQNTFNWMLESEDSSN